MDFSAEGAGARPAPYNTEQPTLRDGPVVLRLPRLADLEADYLACQDPETIRWTTVPSPYTREDAQNFLTSYMPAYWLGMKGASWVLSRADDEGFAGAFDLRVSESDAAIAEVGFAVAPWARGRGLMTAALKLGCAWGFRELGLARIEWRAYVGNDASRRVAEKVGFRYEGAERSRLVHRGRRCDCWLASLLPGDRVAAETDAARAEVPEPRGVPDGA